MTECGIYLNMPEAEYHAVKALSCSGMKDLSVSPLHFWHFHLNPECEQDEETSQQRIGKAAHCRILEKERFRRDYCVMPSPEDYPDALVTIDDMKAWLSQKGLPVSAKRKEELIERIESSGHSHPIIWERELVRINEEMEGKTVLKRKDMDAVERLGKAIESDPAAAAVLKDGMPEVSFFVRHPSGLMLKARMDYVRPTSTIDLKTFSNSRGKATDRAVFDAIYYENYQLQCVFYSMVREMARKQLIAGELEVYGNCPEAWIDGFIKAENHRFGFLFVESDEPHDIRIIEMRRSENAGGDANVYWLDGEIQIDRLIERYLECKKHFGDGPWREPKGAHTLEDTDLPQLMFKRGYDF